MRAKPAGTEDSRLEFQVIGRENHRRRNQVNEVPGSIHAERGIELVIGGGFPVKRNDGGADGLARKWAAANEINCLTVPPKSRIYGWPSCGPLRNKEIALRSPDLRVLFRGGKGSLSAASDAEQAGIEVMKVTYGD
jgi:hypothetical protein